MNNILRFLVTGVAGAFVALSAAVAELAPGALTAGSVSGNVTYATAGSSEFKPLVAGAALTQGSTVKTGANSSATIVFSSGSSAAIGADSTIELTKFEQEAFSGPIPTKGEPSVSVTEIKVVNGTVAAKVNKLKKGSSYTVNSPVGAAGVRGTTFNVSFNASTGQLTVSTIEGLVVLTATATGLSTEVSGTQTKAVVTGVDASSVIVENVVLTPEQAQALVNVVAAIAPNLAQETAATANNALPADAPRIVVPDAPAPAPNAPVVIPDTTVVSPN